jgi:hypothetical protein
MEGGEIGGLTELTKGGMVGGWDVGWWVVRDGDGQELRVHQVYIG